MLRAAALTLLILILLSSPVSSSDKNSPAEGFDLEGSDPQAIDIADRVMEAMGGRENYDNTRYLSWNFFGMRTHIWDKWTGDLRFQQGTTLTLMNVNSREGRIWTDGEEITDPEALAEALQKGYESWINDSYWLLMPYKLKDSGVTLTYLGDGQTEEGRDAHVLQLTFEEVGVTPDNKYHVFVDKERMLVEQWNFFNSYTDDEPRFKTPWAKWTRHGDVLLSGDRGQRQLSDIAVFEELPESVFTSHEQVTLDAYH